MDPSPADVFRLMIELRAATADLMAQSSANSMISRAESAALLRILEGLADELAGLGAERPDVRAAYLRTKKEILENMYLSLGDKEPSTAELIRRELEKMGESI
jgi:hypothetical protein